MTSTNATLNKALKTLMATGKIRSGGGVGEDEIMVYVPDEERVALGLAQCPKNTGSVSPIWACLAYEEMSFANVGRNLRTTWDFFVDSGYAANTPAIDAVVNRITQLQAIIDTDDDNVEALVEYCDVLGSFMMVQTTQEADTPLLKVWLGDDLEHSMFRGNNEAYEAHLMMWEYLESTWSKPSEEDPVAVEGMD